MVYRAACHCGVGKRRVTMALLCFSEAALDGMLGKGGHGEQGLCILRYQHVVHI